MKRLTLILAGMLLCLTAVAQRTYTPNFAIGGKAGATISEMSFSPKVTQSFSPGFMVGVVARYFEEQHFGLIAELNIEQRGWDEKYENGEQFRYRRTLTYVQLPLMTHIRFGSDKVKAFFNIGPEIGYMIGDHISANFDYKDIAGVEGYPQGYRTNSQLSMEVANRFDYGISAGVGMELLLKRRHSAMVEGRFYYGLGNIFSASKRDVFSASRGMSIEITAAYLFRIR